MRERSIKVNFNEEIAKVSGKKKEFPKYTTQIMNLANQNAQGTRPKTVGQMSELIKQCPYRTYEGWRDWYLERHPEAIKEATQKIKDMVDKLKEAILLIDEEMIREWVEDLVLRKTAEGLIVQEIILKTLAENEDSSYRLAGPDEEAEGIDGYIGKKPISIKPITYSSKKPTVREDIEVMVVYYEQKGNNLIITWREASENS